jgi:low temperature requirement protein LtrA
MAGPDVPVDVAAVPSTAAGAEAEPDVDEPIGVSTVELFFDLVFVFTITQLTGILHGDPTARGVGRAALVLCVVLWMYGGFMWLTNSVSPRSGAARLLVLASMLGFFTMALAIPDAFGDAGLAFGLGYLAVTIVHAGMFAASGATRTAIVRILPGNVGGAALVVAAAGTEGWVDTTLWCAAIALLYGWPWVVGLEGFTIRPAHFVERHGLVVLIVMGESVIAVGIGAEGLPVDAELVLAAGLGLVLVAAMWWTWFDGDDERGERALTAMAPERRPVAALVAFGYAFLPILGGIVLVAAGAEEALAHLGEALDRAGAWFLAAGVAAFLAGEVGYRLALGIRPIRERAVTAAVALATVPLGTEVGAEVQMGALVALLVGLVLVERKDRHRAALVGPRAGVGPTPVTVPAPPRYGEDHRRGDLPPAG